MPTTPTPPERFGPAATRSVAEGGTDDPPRITAELGVRSISEDAQPLLDRAIKGLGRAMEEGVLAEYNVFVTGETFTTGSAAAATAVGRDLTSRVADIRDWATMAGATVAPYFHPERVESKLTGDRYTQIRFPTLCLAEYHDGELAFVAPARLDGELVDVLDRIETLGESSDGRVVAPVPE
jgi:hypothetical protein